MELEDKGRQNKEENISADGEEIPVIIRDNYNFAPDGTQRTHPVSGGNGKKQESPQELPMNTTGNTGTKEHEIINETRPETADTAEPELSGKNDRIRELEEQVKRLSAEFENFRRRQEKRYEESIRYATLEVITHFLPFLDSLNQAYTSSAKECNPDAVIKGLELMRKQLEDILAKLGVEEIQAVGEPFDPSKHHAIFVEENPECPEDTVLEEFQKGYCYRERIIRPSMVKVSKQC